MLFDNHFRSSFSLFTSTCLKPSSQAHSMAATKSTASSGKRIRPTSDALPQAITKIAKSAKAMKPIFRGKVMSFSGDFGENWTHEQMANWIKLHGGEYVREITEGTTHLICTIEDYKRKTVQGICPLSIITSPG